MSSSRPQSPSGHSAASSANAQRKIAATSERYGTEVTVDDSYDDAPVIRQILIQTIKRSGLSRAAIADRMSYLLHRSVTEAMLNAFTAESRGDRKWPAEFDRAFCEATGDLTLILDRARRAGLTVISAEEKVLLELGRAHHVRSEAEEAIREASERLKGGKR